VGDNSALKTRLIEAFYSTAVRGHSGVQATYQRMKKMFRRKGMKQEIDSFVKQCLVCQQAKHERQHPVGLLQPLPIPEWCWQDISMDFIEGLPNSEGSNCILVVVDRFSKYSHFIPLKHPFTALQVAKILLDVVVRLHGLPKSIVSDMDKIFTSHLWKELFKMTYTALLTNTAYHHQTDGQTERVNQCLEMFLWCCIHDSPKKWKSLLPLIEFWYNTSFHSSLGCSPFKVLYGYDPIIAAAPMLPVTNNKSVEELLADRQVHTTLIKSNLAKARNRIKLQADKQHTDQEFQVGDEVLLKLQPYIQSLVAYPKISFKFYGPYKILTKVEKVAYKLELPQDNLIHPVFHVSQLKAFTPDYKPVFSKLPNTTDFSQVDLQPKAILERGW
jgi:hypothetical protein